ncbi:hypothetical protein TNCV_1498491 [Trichonephila clavipes]|nr:hypothetical protein TNCV_1498491 [Trichonephila clavipes]
MGVCEGLLYLTQRKTWQRFLRDCSKKRSKLLSFLDSFAVSQRPTTINVESSHGFSDVTRLSRQKSLSITLMIILGIQRKLNLKITNLISNAELISMESEASPACSTPRNEGMMLYGEANISEIYGIEDSKSNFP